MIDGSTKQNDQWTKTRQITYLYTVYMMYILIEATYTKLHDFLVTIHSKIAYDERKKHNISTNIN